MTFIYGLKTQKKDSIPIGQPAKNLCEKIKNIKSTLVSKVVAA